MLIDNKANGKLGQTLREHLDVGACLAMMAGSVSLYAYEVLRTQLGHLDSSRILLSRLPMAHAVGDAFTPLTGETFEVRLRNRLNQASIARQFAEWITAKSEVRVLKPLGMIAQSMFHINAPNGHMLAVQGSSQFTASGLGEVESTSLDMNMGFQDPGNTAALLAWFDNIWYSTTSTEDAKAHLLQELSRLYQDQNPQFVYFLMLYHLFKDYVEELDEDHIIRHKTGFKETLVWNKLYKFQRDGVLGAIEKLERHGGCIIADSVGLGKTFEALAVIKYYELRNDRVLVLCPKKLREDWTLYTVNDKRNLLAGDRFNYDVLNHTDLTREGGQSGEINLASINWGNYDLVVIDESHNFRNNNLRKDGKTRYSKLMQDIIRTGVKTKVLMLSATPVNNRMNDLKNQVAFITEGLDDALSPHGINSIEQTLRKAQTCFNGWVRLPTRERTVAGLLDSLNFDYFKLLDLLTIARSRKHIEKYYGVADIGQFPERLKPRNIKSDIDMQREFPSLHDINRTIRRLHLSAYSPLKYVRMDKREEYSRRYDMQVGQGVFKQVDREQSLVHLMRVNLLKRMESSINSFALTVSSLLAQVEGLLARVEAHSASEVEELSIENIDFDSPEFEALSVGNKVKVLIQDMDLAAWKQDLAEDRYQLQRLHQEALKIVPNRDAKLDDLRALIAAKVASPLNSGNRKLIVFTAFADTAQYLYQQLAPWGHSTLGVHSALVTGTGTNKTTLKGVNGDLANILTNFSPRSKERDKVDPNARTEIDLLIATDCISEGQNLQDCDYLVNYDIHWNPVRIIQRFGRIDRLGSTNERIQLVNFWPNMELDEYINLEARVSGRMVLLDISATGEENIIEQDAQGQMNDLEYRRKQLEQLQENVVDLEDLAGGVSITDLTLNDFRMDLAAYMQAYGTELETAPTGLFAVTRLDASLASEGWEPGVIFCLRNRPHTHKGEVQVDDNYPLAPHFLVYVTESGTVRLPFNQPKAILDLLKKQAAALSQPDRAAVASFNRTTRQGHNTEALQALLVSAIDSIAGKSQEKGVASLFQRGGTVLDAQSSQGIEDFEVLGYLIIEAT